MEWMINKRLSWYLESNSLITNIQTGFRKKRGTVDHLIRLETIIREAFIKKATSSGNCFRPGEGIRHYLKVWYDTSLRRLPLFIRNFLSQRNVRVRVGSTLSDQQNQEEGISQGSILSVTRFSIKINNIAKCLSPTVDCASLRRRLRHLLSRYSHEHNRTTTTEPQQNR